MQLEWFHASLKENKNIIIQVIFQWYRLIDIRREMGGRHGMKEGEENSKRTYMHSP